MLREAQKRYYLTAALRTSAMLLDTPTVDSSNELGEDTWELFELIEKSFGVTLDYATLLGSSIRDIAELIAQQATKPRSEKCLTAAMFYLLRREFVSVLAVPKTSVRPDASLTSLLPWNRRKTRWLLLEKHLQLELPALRMPAWLFGSTLLLSTGAGLLFWETAWKNPVWVGNVTLSTWIALLHLVVPLGRGFPNGCTTVGDLAKLTLGLNYTRLSGRFGSASPVVITTLLIQLIASETGINPDEIAPETRVPQGLNIY
jgi:hypothetical protein